MQFLVALTVVRATFFIVGVLHKLLSKSYNDGKGRRMCYERI
jgi:hypothetical protein